eukprot:TRINITY_DN4920_c0_g2_i1.p1 TRINITY_DN4920_c0_g2~~TRINITY_DN4920_c0_g2_i1.p1  ORF type:complete len:572 (-),score=99.08 TRINITY_DN4920_c0_g2_i1:148-1863(-)
MIERNEDALASALNFVMNNNEIGDIRMCINMISSYLQRIRQNSKFRKVTSTNDIDYSWKIEAVNGGKDALVAAGFVASTTEDGVFENNDDIEKIARTLQRFKQVEERVETSIGRIPRKGIFGEKKNSRAFVDFQGSTRFTVGFCDNIGKRQDMEDEMVILGLGPRCRKNEDYYAVFDGHGGKEASLLAAESLHKHLDRQLRITKGDVVKAMVESFNDAQAVCDKKGMICGTCALVTFFRGKELYISNLGDSRAVLGRKAGVGLAITKDHKPEQPEETERIRSVGGFVKEPEKNTDVYRVNGKISVSRALGDRDFKPSVSHDPDVYSIELTDDDYFVVLACDGIWDAVPDQDAVNLVFQTRDPQTAALGLLRLARKRASIDNISVIVIFLKDRSTWSDVLDNPNVSKVSSHFLVYSNGVYKKDPAKSYKTDDVLLDLAGFETTTYDPNRKLLKPEINDNYVPAVHSHSKPNRKPRPPTTIFTHPIVEQSPRPLLVTDSPKTPNIHRLSRDIATPPIDHLLRNETVIDFYEGADKASSPNPATPRNLLLLLNLWKFLKKTKRSLRLLNMIKLF